MSEFTMHLIVCLLSGSFLLWSFIRKKEPSFFAGVAIVLNLIAFFLHFGEMVGIL